MSNVLVLCVLVLGGALLERLALANYQREVCTCALLFCP